MVFTIMLMSAKNIEEKAGTWNFYLFLFIALMSASFLIVDTVWSEESVKAVASVDRVEVYGGDRVIYELELQGLDDGAEIKYPDFKGAFNGFEFEAVGGKEHEDDFTRRFKIKSFTPGEYEISVPPISYEQGGRWNEIKANSVKVKVLSLLTDGGANADIVDIKNVLGKTPWLLYAIILGVLATIAGVFLFYRYKKRKIQEYSAQNIYKPKPHEVAYAALAALRDKGYINRGMVKEYFDELSLIIRAYIEARFNIKAPYMTTEEFLDSAKRNHLLVSEQKALLEEFLTCSDMVKFAKYWPQSEEVEGSFRRAKMFVDETKIYEQNNNEEESKVENK